MVAVEAAAEELVRVVEAGHRLQVRDARARADRGERERVELVVRATARSRRTPRGRTAACRELSVAAVPPEYSDLVVLAAHDRGAVRAGAFDDDVPLRLLGALPTRIRPPQSPG